MDGIGGVCPTLLLPGDCTSDWQGASSPIGEHGRDENVKRRKHDSGLVFSGVCYIGPDDVFQAAVEMAAVFGPDVGEEWRYCNFRPVWTKPGRYFTVYADRKHTGDGPVTLTPVDVAVVSIARRNGSEWNLKVFFSYSPDLALALVGMLSERGNVALPTDTQTGGGAVSRPEGYELLTDREREIVHFLADGWSDKKIADRLVIAPATVKKHRQNIEEKWGVSGGMKWLQTESKRRGYGRG